MPRLCSRDHLRHVLALIMLTLILGPALAAGQGQTPAGATDSRGVVWMVCDVSGKSLATIRLPLEWLAACDEKGTIHIEGSEPIRCAELWDTYKDLPIGESREIRRAVDREGEPYVLTVESIPRSRDRAQGRVHIVNRNDRGKKTDIAFPLDLPKLLEVAANVFSGFLGGDTTHVRIRDVSIAGTPDLKKLADYGRFVFLDSLDPDSSAVRITID